MQVLESVKGDRATKGMQVLESVKGDRATKDLGVLELSRVTKCWIPIQREVRRSLSGCSQDQVFLIFRLRVSRDWEILSVTLGLGGAS
jgi:hypothetical protein